MRLKYPCLIVLAAVLVLANVVSAQQAAKPDFFPPSWHQYDWMPDCSNEGTPLPGHIKNLHRFTSDNGGVPTQTLAPPDTRRGAAGFFDKSMDVVLHTFGGTQFMTTVREIGGDPIRYSSGTAVYNPAGSGISIVKRNVATNSVVWEKVISDPSCLASSLPRVHVTSTGAYNVTYRGSFAGGDQIIGVQVSSTGTIVQNNISLCGANYYDDIREYDVAPDNVDGFAVIVRAYDALTGNSAILGQGVDQIWQFTWDPFDFMVINTGTTVALTNNTATNKWNPIILWDSDWGEYQMFWGDEELTPNTAMAQCVNSGSITYTAGGVFMYQTELDPRVEFYGLRTSYYNGPTYTGDPLTFLFYRNDTSKLELEGFYMLNVPLGVIANPGFTLPDGYPMALCGYNDGTDVDPVGLFLNANGNLGAIRGDASGALPSPYYHWMTAGPLGPTSARRISFAGANSYGIWTAIPENGVERLYHLNTGTGAFSAVHTVNTRNGDPEGPSYFAGTVDATDFALTQYETGQNLVNPTTRFDVLTSEPHPETGEAYREAFQINDRTTFRIYDSPPAILFSSVTTGEVGTHQMHVAAHAAVYQDQRAAVYERWNSTGTIDLVMGYKNSLGNDVTVTLATGTSTFSYIRPKVGIIYDAVNLRHIAVITYVRNQSATSGYFYQVRNLSNGSTITSQTSLPIAGVFPLGLDIKNWDVVHDDQNACLLFVFGHGYSSRYGSSQGLYMAGFSQQGALLPWATNPRQFAAPGALPGTYKDEVRACFNPDPLNQGAYVAWVQGNVGGGNKSVEFTSVATTTGNIWGAGILSHAGGLNTMKKQPVVAATAAAVFVGWSDNQLGAGNERVYGCAYSNAGAMIAGWNANGVMMTPNLLGTPTYHTSMPDVLMVSGAFQPIVMLSFLEREVAANNFAGSHRIGVLTYNLQTNAQVARTGLAFPAQAYEPGTTSTHEIEAMHGFVQRRPKLAMAPVSINDPYSPPQPHYLCTFETHALNLASFTHNAVATMEAARIGAGERPFLENNITGIVLNGNLEQTAKFSVARKAGAQDLIDVFHTSNQGFVAAYTDYAGTSGTAGVAKFVKVNMEVRDYSNFGGAGYNLTWTGPTQTRQFRIFNNSLIGLKVSMTSESLTAQTPTPYITWGIDPDVTISAYGNANVDLDYTPGGAMGTNNDDVTVRLYPHMFTAVIPPPPPYYTNMMSQHRITGSTGTGVYKPSVSSSGSGDGLNVTLMPNPATVQTTALISGHAGANAELKLINMLGQTVWSNNVIVSENGTAETMMDVKQLPSGSYIFQVSEYGAVAHTRFVIP